MLRLYKMFCLKGCDDTKVQQLSLCIYSVHTPQMLHDSMDVGILK